MALEIKITPCGDGSYKLEIPNGVTIDCNYWIHDPADTGYKYVKPPPEGTIFPNKLGITFIESNPNGRKRKSPPFRKE